MRPGIRQKYRFWAQSETQVEDFLRGAGSDTVLNEEGETFEFRDSASPPRFKIVCTILIGGIHIETFGDYQEFFCRFFDGLVRKFGPLTAKDAAKSGAHASGR